MFIVIDLPSHVQVAAMGVAVKSGGLVSTSSVSLLTVAEMDKALSEDAKYQAPGH